MKENFFEYYNQAGLTAGEQNPKLVIRNNTPKNMEGGEGQNPKQNEIDSLSRDIKNEVEKSLREGLTQHDKEAMKAAGLNDFISNKSTIKGNSTIISLEQQEEVRKYQQNAQQENIPNKRKAIWKSHDGDLPVTIIGTHGLGPDGKEYFITEDIPGGILAEQVEFIDGFDEEKVELKEQSSKNKSIGRSPETHEDKSGIENLKDGLIGEIGHKILNRANNINEEIRYEQWIRRLMDTQDEKQFLEGYNKFVPDVLSQAPRREKVEPNTHQDAENLISDFFESLQSRDQLFESLFTTLDSLNAEQARNIYTQFGEFFVRVGSDGTGREDEYVQKLGLILRDNKDVKSDIKNLLAEVRAAAAVEDNGADRPFSEEVANEEIAGEIEEAPSIDGGKGGDDGEPPKRTGDGSKEDDDGSEDEDSNNKDEEINIEAEITGKAKNWFDAIVDLINNSENVENIREILDKGIKPRLEPILNEVYNSSTGQTWADKIYELTLNNDIVTLRAEVKPFLEKTRDKFTTTAEREEREKPPQSVEELMELIMSKETDEYKTGGKRELMRADGTVRFENFHAWVISKANFWSNFNPDSSVDLFNLISIPMTYRTISFQEMVTNPQYFRRRERKLLLNENGQPVIDRFGNRIEYSDQNHADKHYDTIKSKIMNNIFYFNMSRNFSVQYIESMEDDSKLGGVVADIVKKNHMTKEGFQVLFSLPSTLIPDTAQDREGEEENYLMGEATSLGYNIYDSVSDYESLVEMLGNGKDNVLFSKNYIQADGTSLKIDQLTQDQINDIYDFKDKASATIDKDAQTGGGVGINYSYDEDWYDENGLLKNEDWAKYQFLDYINIFNEQKKDPRIVNQLRERVRQTLVFKMLPRIENGELHNEIRERFRNQISQNELQKAEGERMPQAQFAQQVEFEAKKELLNFIYTDAVHAEEVAYSFVRWTGAGAKNDTTATGFDAGTKFMETMAYRIRQGAESRGGGGVGAIKDIAIYKRLVMPIMSGIKTTNGDTPKEFTLNIAKNIGKKQKNISSKDIAGKIIFANNALREYGANHYARAGGIFESLSGAKELDLSKLITFDPHKGPVINKQAVISELNEGFLKPERYRTATYDGVDYRKKFRFLDIAGIKPIEVEVIDTNGNIVKKRYRQLNYKTESLAEAMFGPQVFDRAYRKPDGTVDVDKVQSDRSNFWKEGISVRLATLLASHRDSKDPVEKWNPARVNAFLAVLRAIPAEIDVDEKNFWNNKAKKRFFNKNLENRLRKLSKTEEWRLVLSDLSTDVGGGLLKGIFDSMKIILKDAVS